MEFNGGVASGASWSYTTSTQHARSPGMEVYVAGEYVLYWLRARSRVSRQFSGSSVKLAANAYGPTHLLAVLKILFFFP